MYLQICINPHAQNANGALQRNQNQFYQDEARNLSAEVDNLKPTYQLSIPGMHFPM